MDFLSQLTVDDMPNQEMRWVAEDCGLDVAIEMIRRLRGVRVYVPSMDLDKPPQTPVDMPNEDMQLVAELCGLELAMKLLDKMAGVTISIPQKALPINSLIISNFNGRNANRLAIQLGVSRSFVYKVAKASGAGVPALKRSCRLEELKTG